MSSTPYQELRAEMRGRGRAFGMAIACLIDHAAAIGTYEQKLTTELDAEIREIMARAQAEEFRRFARDLEYSSSSSPSAAPAAGSATPSRSRAHRLSAGSA